jgi:predicted RNA polymerase sigma factor
LFGIVHIEIAEDITNDTFLLAAETWGLKGIPDNPTAWLIHRGQKQNQRLFQRHKTFSEKIAQISNTIKNNLKKLTLICRWKILLIVNCK